MTNNGVIFIPALIKCQMNKTTSRLKSTKSFLIWHSKFWPWYSESKSILPIRNSLWITSNALFTECWKLNTMFDWVVNITSDIFLLQNITQIWSLHHWYNRKRDNQSKTMFPLPRGICACTWWVLVFGVPPSLTPLTTSPSSTPPPPKILWE